MKKIVYTWEIYNSYIIEEQRYCHNCGEKVVFTDSGLRRHNANGKDIFEFAIYKCINGHTWNKALGIFKSSRTFNKKVDRDSEDRFKLDIIHTKTLIDAGYNKIEIQINGINGKHRLDKVLSVQIADLSRSQIEKYIDFGKILVNNHTVKPGELLKKGNVVTIELLSYI